MKTDSDLQEQLTRYLADEERFQTDMLIVRGMSGENVGQSLSAVTGRAASLRAMLAKEREERDGHTEQLTMLLIQLQSLRAMIDDLDIQLASVDAEISALDDRLNILDTALARLDAGDDPATVILDAPELREELEDWMAANGVENLDLSDAAAFRLVLIEVRRDHAQEKRDLEDRRDQMRERRDGLAAEAAALEDDIRLVAPDDPVIDKAASLVSLEQATALLETADRTDADISLYVRERELADALDPSAETATTSRDSYEQNSKAWDGMDLGFSDLSAADAVAPTPIKAEALTGGFNLQAHGANQPKEIPTVEQADSEPTNLPAPV